MILESASQVISYLTISVNVIMARLARRCHLLYWDIVIILDIQEKMGSHGLGFFYFSVLIIVHVHGVKYISQ